RAAPRSSEEIALEESHNQQRQVDPFRIGYNMGMQNIHLETLRNKLDDNVELLKSHFNSLRETQRNGQETLRAMQVEYNKQTRKQFDDGVESLRERLDQLSQRINTNEEMVRELSRQQFESLQKHVDDRLENIKDTVKLSVGILFALNLWILFLVNQ
ncbi:transmembrane protein, putative, partial [Bodo saltans]